MRIENRKRNRKVRQRPSLCEEREPRLSVSADLPFDGVVSSLDSGLQTLFASFPVIVSTWKGFDPLPVLAAAKKTRTKADPAREKARRQLDAEEAALNRLLTAGEYSVDHSVEKVAL